jgi:A/G-specific adenine glycosylase
MLLRRADFCRRLLNWYDRSHRDLPWRVRGQTTHPSPYHVLVSEFMLQQTQVATVIPYFQRFMERFPTIADLAAADEQEVLRHWQGLGYYARARNLLRCARQVVTDHGGSLPADVTQLRSLAGIGRYTAGAISSIGFGRREPILDANVTRVVLRVDQIESDPRERAVQELLWRRAEEILPSQRVGDFNSALMELGALICTPRSPQCLVCPVRKHCEAFAAGMAERIPAPRKKPPIPLLRRHTFCIQHGNRWLIERRPAKGRWAGMWQFITLAADDSGALPVKTTSPSAIGNVSHTLTHRQYEFQVFRCVARGTKPPADSDSRRWVDLDELEKYPLPRPHVHIARMLASIPNLTPNNLT